MRRITSACLLQTMRFDNLNGENPEQELEIYCKKLDMKKAAYAIEEKTSSRGALLVKTKDSHNQYKTDWILRVRNPSPKQWQNCSGVLFYGKAGKNRHSFMP